MTFSPEVIDAAWRKAQADPHNNSNLYRKDACNAWIKRDEYGNRNSEYGWEIDHIEPNGNNDSSNLRALQWRNNVSKGRRHLRCSMVKDGVHNKKV